MARYHRAGSSGVFITARRERSTNGHSNVLLKFPLRDALSLEVVLIKYFGVGLRHERVNQANHIAGQIE
jgi:hypothetical protein